MTKNEKIIACIIIGAVAGVGATIFFETKQGKKLLEDLKQLASEKFDDALEKLTGFGKKFNEPLAADNINDE
jgi:hypothetical protein